ncbi:MAG: hypothetical protein HY519_04160 [Candidatus Aenigmarchaeota archaeon]|nr:hypothetical protein [Candidatus Aenigmarchaeota archaeon]
MKAMLLLIVLALGSLVTVHDAEPLVGTCTDTDRLTYPTSEPLVAGTCSGIRSERTDFCLNYGRLAEHFCRMPSSSVCTRQIISCRQHCLKLGAMQGDCALGACVCEFPAENIETDNDVIMGCDAGDGLEVILLSDVVVVDDKPDPLQQPNNYTCAPTSLAWVVKLLNQSVPSLTKGLNESQLIENLSRHLNTTAQGTGMRGLFFGLARYINESGKNFTIKMFGNWTQNASNGRWNLDWNGDNHVDWWVKFPKNASTTKERGQNLTVSPVNQSFLNTIAREIGASEGVILVYEWAGGVHAVAVHSINDESFHLIEIMDPARGEVITAEIDGNTIIYDTGTEIRRALIRFILSASPAS